MLDSKVIILMTTYNGQRYLKEQLESICAQTHQNWQLWVSDDGSSDETRSILQDYQSRLGEHVLQIVEGPRQGFAANFLSLACHNPLDGTYFAYSDQDDIWYPDKLEVAVAWLNTIPADCPALYCARTRLVDGDGVPYGLSPLFQKPPSFLNALIQNIGGGNTMVFNQSALNLLREAGRNISVAAHDWWTYMLVTGAGGMVFYDPYPRLDYRQHGANQIGGNIGYIARLSRLSLLLRGQFKTWNDLNLSALSSVQHRLTAENRQIVLNVIEARRQRFTSRLIQLKRVGLYRQTLSGNLGLMVAGVLNKI